MIVHWPGLTGFVVMLLGILMVMQRLTMKNASHYIVFVWTVITWVYIGKICRLDLVVNDEMDIC